MFERPVDNERKGGGPSRNFRSLRALIGVITEKYVKTIRAVWVLGFLLNPLLLIRAGAAEDIDLNQVSAIHFSAGNNSVTVSTSNITTASFAADSSCQITPSTTIVNGVLTIETSDPEQTCAYSLIVPTNFQAVRIDSSNGAVSFSGTAGQLVVVGDNGSATVSNSAIGTLLVTNTNGPITVDTVSASSSAINSTNADITISKLNSPFAIDATNGELRISATVLPFGSKSSVRKTNDKVTITGVKVRSAGSNKRARLKLTTRTLNGAVTVKRKKLANRGRTKVTMLGKGKQRATLSIVTVNADIVVK